jgi:hypothetical protein
MDLLNLAWLGGAVLIAAAMGYHHLMDGVPLRRHRAQLRSRLARRFGGALFVATAVLALNLTLIALSRTAG